MLRRLRPDQIAQRSQIHAEKGVYDTRRERAIWKKVGRFVKCKHGRLTRLSPGRDEKVTIPGPATKIQAAEAKR
jgi:hypothetical protein